MQLLMSLGKTLSRNAPLGLDTFGGAQTPPFRAGKECAALSINPQAHHGL